MNRKTPDSLRRGDAKSNPIEEIEATLDIYEAAETGATIVTATRRLSRELTARFDRRQLSLNKSAWQSADILPWDAWIERCWSNTRTHRENTPLLLSDQQLLSIWHNIVIADIAQNEEDTEPLWHTRSSALAGIQALKLLREWQIDAQRVAESSHRDHRCFSRWLNQFDQLCQARNWVDRYQLPQLLHQTSFTESDLVLAGFDRLLPQQLALIRVLLKKGCNVTQSEAASESNSSTQSREFSTEREHWMGAAGWARTILEQDPTARLAIVPANPGKSRELIDYSLKQVLCPDQIIEPGQSAPLPFHISLGNPLSTYPIVRDALLLLTSVCKYRQRPEVLCQLVRSSYLRGAESEFVSRAELELWIRQNLPQDSDFRQILRHLNYRSEEHGEDHHSILRKVLAKVDQRLKEANTMDYYTNWSNFFNDLLFLLGWPGQQTPDTEEFQTAEAFREQLRSLAELDLHQSTVNLTKALSALQHCLDQQIFQIEGNEAPVQVMGVLETSGMTFDHIWFGSLVASDWPGAKRPNPFIPLQLQQLAGVEQASAEANFQHAQKQQQRLSASCETLTLGFHRFDAEVSVEQSPLLTDENEIIQDTNDVPKAIAWLMHRDRPLLEKFTDDIGSPVANPASVRGGTSLIQMQSACPRGAYAAFRLGAQLIEDNEPGLDAAERGSLVHRALELAWKSVQSSNRLKQMSEEDIQSVLQSSVSNASARFRARSGCGDQYFFRLHSWLVATLKEWFSLEQQRTEEFTVLGMEEKTQLQLGELQLDFKIDRIDRLASGQLVLIDYKTGTQNNVAAWADERLSAPQLPLYTLAQQQLGHMIHAVAFAEVRLGACTFIGMAAADGFGLPEARQIRVKAFDKTTPFKDRYSSWPQCTTHWRYALENLAEEFVFGDARIAPGNEGICEQCPTPAICRSGNQTAVEAE